MADKTITSADSVYVLSSSDVLPAAVQLQGYAADAAFATEQADTAEVLLGVDGKMSAGWVPRMYTQTISLQADSPSVAVFDAIATAQDAAKTVFRLNGVITLPGVGMSYTMNRGVLTRYKPMADAKRTLAPVEYQITWESVRPAKI